MKKFGGTSVGNAERMKDVSQIVKLVFFPSSFDFVFEII